MTVLDFPHRIERKKTSMSIVPAVAELLDELGLALGAQQVEIIDFNQAESCYIHHTRAPVAVAGYACVSPAFAQGRFPKFSFLDLIAKRPSMDESEACALAAICKADATPPFWGNPGPFGKQLVAVIDRYELGDFFERLDHKQAYGNGGDHYLIRGSAGIHAKFLRFRPKLLIFKEFACCNSSEAPSDLNPMCSRQTG